MPKPQQLVYPHDAEKAMQAIEIFRAWIIDEGFQCSLMPGVFGSQPGMWGLVFADAIQHVSNAISQETGTPKEEILQEIVRLLNAELSNPTDTAKGDFVSEH